jgi:hypothetical protein
MRDSVRQRLFVSMSITKSASYKAVQIFDERPIFSQLVDRSLTLELQLNYGKTR